jgi:DNA replication protein DnaC
MPRPSEDPDDSIKRIQHALQSLGLKSVEARLEALLEQASKKEPSYADFLDELLGCEVEARRSRYLRARLQLAHLPFAKNFDQFEFGFQPSIDERQIRELRTDEHRVLTLVEEDRLAADHQVGVRVRSGGGHPHAAVIGV